VSDRWGRIFLFLHYGDHFSVTLDKDGYSAQMVSAECKAGDAFSQDLTLTLEPIRRE